MPVNFKLKSSVPNLNYAYGRRGCPSHWHSLYSLQTVMMCNENQVFRYRLGLRPGPGWRKLSPPKIFCAGFVLSDGVFKSSPGEAAEAAEDSRCNGCSILDDRASPRDEREKNTDISNV